MTTTSVQDLIGRTAVDSDNEKIGKIEQIYLDNETGQPTWVAVSTGLLRSGRRFAPMYNAHAAGDDVALGVTKQKVQDAPNIETTDGRLEPNQEEMLFDYYSGYTGDRHTIRR